MYCTSLYSYFKNLCCAIKILLFHIWLFLILYNSQSVICTHDFPFQDSESPPENLFKGSILDSITDTMPNWKSTFLRLKQRFLRYRFVCMCVCVCETLCDPMDCSLSRLLCLWDFPGKKTGVGCHFLFQRILPTQGLNWHLLHRQMDSLSLSHLVSPPWSIIS